MILTGSELRKRFLQFFASKQHLVLPSASLIPQDDPSLLLIGAGMAPFKPFFTGKMNPPNERIATCQKCIRTGDIENVGRTARHHTFFEMLGNFSFGNYFKKEAIAWAWEFLTEDLKLAKDKLWITIHTSDDEAFDLWHQDIGIPVERIIRLEDNFWEIGPGPCGPCSEIHYDLGETRGCGKPDCQVGCDCDRYLEIWNLVFTQFDRDEAGNYTPLAKKNIDTGAGLERIASILQDKPSNFETDLLFPIIEYTMKVAGVRYSASPKTDVSLKVIADHARSVTVMIADGVLPSNEGRGYVLRRVLRRAVRHGRLMGIERPFLAEIVDVVAAIFADVYPDLYEKQLFIKKVIQQEEERFHATLAQGIELLTTHVNSMKQRNERILDGITAFKLYDTFGFPWELTFEILEENGMELDKAAFDAAMKEQRERARAARQERDDQIVIPDLSSLVTQNLVYHPATESATILVLLQDGKIVETAHAGEEVAVVLDSTSFYAEGGGQVGDTGELISPLGRMQVANTKKLPDGTIYHIGEVLEGGLTAGEVVSVQPDSRRKSATARNHTATHLLQAALRHILGTHVNQAGSLVTPERLRFDFSHFAPITQAELSQVEDFVNSAILSNTPIGVIETTPETAKEMGATALFGEKYGDIVRVVVVDNVSRELCGGTHVEGTGEIGLFRIVSESSVGAGIRRIEAVTGYGALEYIKSREAMLQEAAVLLKSRPEEISAKIQGLLNRTKEIEHELAMIQGGMAKASVEKLLSQVSTVEGVELAVGQVNARDMDELRSVADMVRDRLTTGVVVLGAVQDGKVSFVAMATQAAQAKGIHAGNIIKEVAKAAGGGGGGRADMAQAGGKNLDKLTEALAVAKAVVENQVKK